MATYFDWRPYVPIAQRRARAVRDLTKRLGKGQEASPVLVTGRTIARTFWGRAWCENLESYSDFSNRLPRGRSYLRNGSVVHLNISAGRVDAFVSGTSLYHVRVRVAPVPPARWSGICRDCGGAIDSLVELLQGRFSTGIMERLCQKTTGLFPSPKEIQLECSCPDWATMCKHVASVLYGIGARLDGRPELLFKLRAVDENDLMVRVGRSLPLAKKGPSSRKILDASDVSTIFGLDMADDDSGVGGSGGAPNDPADPSPRRVKRPRARLALSRRGAAHRVVIEETSGAEEARGSVPRRGKHRGKSPRRGH